MWVHIYVPPTQYLVFGVDHVHVSGGSIHTGSFFSVPYLLNQWMDFDQTCIDTLLGRGNMMIRYW